MRLQLVQSVSFASTPASRRTPGCTLRAEEAHAAALRALLTWTDDLSSVGVATTIGEYLTLHRAYDQGVGVTRKTSRKCPYDRRRSSVHG
jgi:hypothetical protein